MPKKRRRMKSYEMIADHMKGFYLQFYDATYKGGTAINQKNKELIAIAASLIAQCQGCLKGHIKKAISLGATREEISEAIVIAVGVNAAAVVDQTDIANFDVDFISMFEQMEREKKARSNSKQKKATRKAVKA